MSLDKAILHGKEKRKPFRNPKAIDATCRNHGSCPWCRDNRLYKHHLRELSAEEQIHEWSKGMYDDPLEDGEARE